ncbi:MAG: DUF4388 domain-containing protein [Thermodesulfobacteriota bacterium]
MMEENPNRELEEIKESLKSGMVGDLAGLSVPSLIQMLQYETRTTLVVVKGNGLQNGTIFFDSGNIIDAACGRLKGDAAVLEMISWETVQTSFKPVPEQKPARTVNNSSIGLLMEGMRIRDESQQGDQTGVRDEDEGQDDQATGVSRDEVKADQTRVNKEAVNQKKVKGSKKMAGLKQLLKDISDEMDGVIAVGVVGMDGITVAAHNPTGVDMDVISAKFAMVMKLVERSVGDLGSLGNFEENLVQTANSWVLTRFLDKQYYFATIVSRDGTLGNIRLVAKKYIEQVQRAL